MMANNAATTVAVVAVVITTGFVFFHVQTTSDASIPVTLSNIQNRLDAIDRTLEHGRISSKSVTLSKDDEVVLASLLNKFGSLPKIETALSGITPMSNCPACPSPSACPACPSCPNQPDCSDMISNCPLCPSPSACPDSSACPACPSPSTQADNSGVVAPTIAELKAKWPQGDPRLLQTGIEKYGLPWGWFGGEEFKLLYMMGRYCPGPLLEQGPFAGRSTHGFALGLRDYAKDNPGKDKKTFLSTDVFPIHPSKAAANAIGAQYPNYWQPSTVTPGRTDLFVDNVRVGDTPALGPERETLLTVGLHDSMVGHLSKNQLLPYVNVVTGSYYPNLPYHCAFFDTAHQATEIVDRLGDWINTVKLGNGKRQLLAFHDNFGQPGCKGMLANVMVIKEHATFDQTWTIEVAGLQPFYQKTVDLLPSMVELNALATTAEQMNACRTMCEKVMNSLPSPVKLFGDNTCST